MPHRRSDSRHRDALVFTTVALALTLASGCDETPPDASTDAMPGSMCCDPADEPGAGDNPICFEGATCCADGSWQCNDFGGPPTCDGFGGACMASLCDPATEPGAGDNPVCVEGHSCCPDGEWSCNDVMGQPFCPP